MLRSNLDMLKIISSKVVTSQELSNLMGEMGGYMAPLREVKHKLQNVWRDSPVSPEPGPGQQRCGICQRYLPNGGITDTNGVSGKPPGTLLCPFHADQFGVRQSGAVTNPVSPTAPARPATNPLPY